MPSPIVFNCPECGASLTAEPGQLEIQCKFCGSTVVVPLELRTPVPTMPPPAAPPPTRSPEIIIVEQPPMNIYEQMPGMEPGPGPAPRRRRRGCGCGCGCLGPIFGLLVLFIALSFVLYNQRPAVFGQIMAQIQPIISNYSSTPQIILFAATPTIASSGEQVTVVWVTNGDTVRLDRVTSQGTQTIPSLSGTGERVFTISNETGQIVFNLTISKNGKQQSATTSVTIRRR